MTSPSASSIAALTDISSRRRMPGFDEDPVDDHLDRVVAGFGERDLLVEIVDPTVDAHPDIPFLHILLEKLLELALAVADYRAQGS